MRPDPVRQILVADVRNGNFVGAEDRIRLPGTGTFGNVLQKLLAKREKDGAPPRPPPAPFATPLASA